MSKYSEDEQYLNYILKKEKERKILIGLNLIIFILTYRLF